MYSVAFICMGNLARSVMAKAIFDKMLMGNGNKNIESMSAGLTRLSGAKAAENTIEICSKNGLDVSSHRSRQVDGGLIYEADLVLTMEIEQMNYLQSVYTEHSSKIFTLTGYAEGTERNIHDPYGEGLDIFEDVFNEIKLEIERILPSLLTDLENREIIN